MANRCKNQKNTISSMKTFANQLKKIEIKYNKGGGVNVFIDNFFHYQTSWGLEWEKERTNETPCNQRWF